MRRRAKPAKAKVEAKLPVARKSPNSDGAKLRDLEKRLAEALEQQTATAEILRVISRSQTNVQPVFDTIAKSALGLCDGTWSGVWRYDGQLIHLVALANLSSQAGEAVRRAFPRPPSAGGYVAQAILMGNVVHRPDIRADPEYQLRELADAAGFLGALCVPMLRDGQPIGVIGVARAHAGAFSPKRVELLQTFADQAVIAIENVRLFNETKEALEQQTATAEILKVISSSPTDVQPVFDAIVRTGTRLCEASLAFALRYDGQLMTLVANHNATNQEIDAAVQAFPRPATPDSLGGRVLLERAVVQIADVSKDPTYRLQAIKELGWRTGLGVPLLRGGTPIGAFGMWRRAVRPFGERQIALLETFADQAVIAIENVRLFKELESANRELAAASQHKSEFLANMSHELRTPLNAIIGFSEVLSEKMFGELNEKQEEYSKDIHASGQHLLSLINDILDLSKIEAGRMELELTDFDLPTAIENALMLVRERAGRRSLTLHKSVDAGVGQLRADERKIRQIVLNLLSNAIKFTPEGGRVELTAVPKNGFVEISVRDTGVGIAPEDQERVFEEFRQVGTAEKKAEGTGLGLTLCRKFVELHGGRIWVKSQQGQGSVFTFTIPIGK